MTGLTRTICLAAALSGGAGAAHAGLTICNDTTVFQSVAVGYLSDAEVWTSEGWWVLEPGACAEPIAGELKKRYYYYRAETEAAEFEGEGYFFCTREEEFTIEGDTNCAGRGYERTDFGEIDTGETATDFTFRIGAAATDLAEDDEADEDTAAEPDATAGQGAEAQSGAGAGAAAPEDDDDLVATPGIEAEALGVGGIAGGASRRGATRITR